MSESPQGSVAPVVVDSTEAWRRYVSTGAIEDALLRPWVARAWERAHGFSANPRQPKAEALGVHDAERLVEERHSLIAAAAPYMRALSRAAGASRHAVMLSEPRAILLDRIGDAETMTDSNFPRAGTLLAEENCGANGVGTTLAEGKYVELIASEHFIEGFHAFTCQGVPIRKPDGALVGVLSTSVRTPQSSERLREILICSAQGIQAELLREELETRSARLIESLARPPKVLPSTSVGEDLSERLRQDLMQPFSAMRLQLETATRLLAHEQDRLVANTLDTARRTIAKIERQARIWRALVSDTSAEPRLVRVDAALSTVVEMLSTEARVREADLASEPLEPLEVHIDPWALARRIFRALLRALDLAGPRGAVRVRTVPQRGQVRVDIIQASGKTRRLGLSFIP